MLLESGDADTVEEFEEFEEVKRFADFEGFEELERPSARVSDLSMYLTCKAPEDRSSSF